VEYFKHKKATEFPGFDQPEEDLASSAYEASVEAVKHLKSRLRLFTIDPTTSRKLQKAVEDTMTDVLWQKYMR
jgi:hypothetical protein